MSKHFMYLINISVKFQLFLKLKHYYGAEAIRQRMISSDESTTL